MLIRQSAFGVLLAVAATGCAVNAGTELDDDDSSSEAESASAAAISGYYTDQGSSGFHLQLGYVKDATKGRPFNLAFKRGGELVIGHWTIVPVAPPVNFMVKLVPSGISKTPTFTIAFKRAGTSNLNPLYLRINKPEIGGVQHVPVFLEKIAGKPDGIVAGGICSTTATFGSCSKSDGLICSMPSGVCTKNKPVVPTQVPGTFKLYGAPGHIVDPTCDIFTKLEITSNGQAHVTNQREGTCAVTVAYYERTYQLKLDHVDCGSRILSGTPMHGTGAGQTITIVDNRARTCANVLDATLTAVETFPGYTPVTMYSIE